MPMTIQEIGIFTERNACRSCSSKCLLPILNLGNIYISDFVESEIGRGKAPLELVLCENCKLLQLRHTVNPDLLYHEYWYKSGINAAMRQALKDIVIKAEKIVKPGDLVLDIGCNDGTMLRMYDTQGLKLIGFEPAINIIEEARKDTTTIINDFFSYEAFRENFGNEKAKIITAIAMFYDLDEPNIFVSDVVKCLDENGVFIIEQRYLPSMLEQNDIGNICHEHLEYYCLLSLRKLLDRHRLELFDVELNDVNGGSFRTYIKHKGASIVQSKDAEKRLRNLESYEKSLGLNGRKIYDDFASRVKNIKFRLYNFLQIKHDRGKIIHIYGASTKGNTILQYFGLDDKLIEAAAERDHRKVGRKTVGTNIPIITEEESRSRADFFLVLIWHFKDNVIKREREFLKSGGKMIFPLPNIEIISRKNLI